MVTVISPPILMSCSSHTEPCNEFGTTVTDDYMHIDDMRAL